MKKKANTRFFIFILIVLLAGFGYWVWTLGSIPQDTQEQTSLEISDGTVQIRQQSSDKWQDVLDADKELIQEIQKDLKSKYERWGASLPDSPFNKLERMSERIHLTLAGENKFELSSSYFARRLYGINTLIEKGKSGLAFQSFTDIERDIEDALKTAKDSEQLVSMQRIVFEQYLMLIDVGPSSPLYRLKQKLEDLQKYLVVDDAELVLYTGLLSVNSRLGEAWDMVQVNELEEAKVILGAAQQGIDNIQRELEQTAGNLSADAVKNLSAVLKAQKTYEATIQSQIQAIEKQEQEEQERAERGEMEKLSLFADPNSVVINGTSKLSLTGFFEDGSSEDLTSEASFELVSGEGLLNSNSFTSDEAGKAVIEATMIRDETTQTATIEIQVTEAKKLSKLEIMAQGETTVAPGETVDLVARAQYADGSTQIVTVETTWSSSDKNVGSVSNGVFTAWIKGSGTVTITGKYTEDGVSESDSIVFEVKERE
ncbi:MAG: DUF5667 domain-containing protein [Patescibacteria group bacterium]